jgi:hypothetical protein
VQLKIKVTCGGEVNWAGASQSGPVYYGGPPPETGMWKLSVAKIEDYFDAALKGLSYGDSIETFVLGFEIGDLEDWGDFFTSMSNYTSYRPKMKLVISVGQINWRDVKDQPAKEQFQKFSEVLLEAIGRVAEMKRKPKGFDSTAFFAVVARLLAQCRVDQVAA